MALVVTGLSQNGDIDALHKALADAGLSTDSLQVIGPEESSQGLSRGLISADIMTRDSGTGVPGITSSGGRIGGGAFFRNEELDDRLGDLEIPDSEMDNYLEALERGKYIVAYFAQADTIDAVENAFKASTLANVRRF